MAGTSKRTQHDDTTDGATQDAKTAADEQTPAGEIPQPVHATTTGDQGRTTVRLPFVTASFTRSSTPSSTSSSTSSSGDNGGGLPNPLSALAGAGHAVTSAVASTPPQKLLFYTGVAALGVVGVVEWPVAALVATGTYVASRSTAANHGVTGTTDATDSGHRPLTSPTEP
jgi:hypothetical protein